MLLFLREPYITPYVHEYTNLTKACGPSINNNLKIAANAWRCEHKFNWGPFIKPLQSKLSGGQITISTINHHRLLLEDFMLLKKGEKVLLSISSNHKMMLKKKGGNMTFFRNILQSVEIDGMRPQSFRKMIYFACNLEVSANATQQNLEDRNYTVEEVK